MASFEFYGVIVAAALLATLVGIGFHSIIAEPTEKRSSRALTAAIAVGVVVLGSIALVFV